MKSAIKVHKRPILKQIIKEEEPSVSNFAENEVDNYGLAADNAESNSAHGSIDRSPL